MGGGWGADREAASRWSWHRWHFLDTASLWWLGEGPPQQAWSLQCPVQSRTVSSKWCDHVLVPGSCVCGLIWESDPRRCEWLKKKKKAALAEGVIHAWYLHTKETQSRGGGHGTQAEIPAVWPQLGDAQIPQTLERWEGAWPCPHLDVGLPGSRAGRGQSPGL